MANITQQTAVVPGVTQQALDAIADQNVRTVLQQVVTGWQVRNGAAGDGSNAFVTRGDLGLAQSSSGGSGAGGSSLSADSILLTPGAVTALVNAVQASILASPFFQSLGTSFNAPSGITKKQTILSNSVGQLSQDVTTLGSSVGNLNASLIQEAETRANADGQLEAQWFVKTDVNGYISGFGLYSTAKNGTPTSQFFIRADAFAIGSPSGPGIAPSVPFVVYTTPQNIGGQVVQPGVYIGRAVIANGMIDTAAIANAAITRALIGDAAIGSAQIGHAEIQTAHIGEAQIDTLRIGANAVTTMANTTGTTSAAITYASSGGAVLIIAATSMAILDIYVDGVRMTNTNNPAITWCGVLGVGGFSITVSTDRDPNPPSTDSSVTLTVFEAKR
jgi:hypothetical protein